MDEPDITVSGDLPDESVLLDRLREAVAMGRKTINIINGFVVDTDSSVSVLFGPVLGEVTTDSAIIMLEVQGPEKIVPISCKLYKEDETGDPAAVLEVDARSKRPFVFTFCDLEPDTRYTAVMNGVAKYHATHRIARFKTKPEEITRFRMLAASCDRPGRLLLGQQNPWIHMLRRIDNVDCVLHLGDQIYPDNEDIADADVIFSDIFDSLSEDKQRSMMLRGRALWRNKYRTVFSKEGKVDVVARVSNLMIWSDNDVANDFTTMKKVDGEQKYHPNFLQCGMRTYREYQRRLWDPECELQLPETTEEWHSHFYGPIGIFMFDLRGHRINGEGQQASENPLISDEQWAALEEFFANPDLRVAVLCSETPFVGDEPDVCREKVEADPRMDFLRDHWPFNADELLRLLDFCFAWKHEGEESGTEREILMLGGDIHCGVTSVIRDDETGQQITHLTTSPVTNHVCKFFPPPQGQISER